MPSRSAITALISNIGRILRQAMDWDQAKGGGKNDDPAALGNGIAGTNQRHSVSKAAGNTIPRQYHSAAATAASAVSGIGTKLPSLPGFNNPSGSTLCLKAT